MALNLTALTEYTNEHGSALIKESILQGRTVELVTIQGGIKKSATVNRISSTLSLQAGACGWNPSGTTTLDQRVISVSDVKVDEAICLSDLEEFYTSTMLNPGSYNEDIPFEQIFSENKRDAILKAIEDVLWQGDTDSTTIAQNLRKADGYIKLFDAELSGTQVGTYAATDSLIDVVDEMIAALNEDVIDRDDLTIFLSMSDYRKYVKALRDANLYHYTATDSGKFDIMHPASNVKVVGTAGLKGAGKIVLAPAKNLVVGTDLLNDAEDFKIWYSQDADEVRFKAKFKLGTQVQFIDYVVMYTLV